jgi:DNA-binding NarL/FixJ family response regulator
MARPAFFVIMGHRMSKSIPAGGSGSRLHAAGAPIQIWLIEDNDAYRNALERVINGSDGLHCPRTFSSCEAALQALAAESSPQVILLDVGLPGMSGIEGIKHLKTNAPTTHVIMLTMFDDHDKVFQSICAGASGYLLKTSPQAEITEGIREVLAGGAPMNARIARSVLEMFTRLAAPKGDYGLTGREEEVLELMVRGLIKKEIADRLSLSYHTIDSHLRNIYQKLHVHTRTGAVAKAIKERLF